MELLNLTEHSFIDRALELMGLLFLGAVLVLLGSGSVLEASMASAVALLLLLPRLAVRFRFGVLALEGLVPDDSETRTIDELRRRTLPRVDVGEAELASPRLDASDQAKVAKLGLDDSAVTFLTHLATAEGCSLPQFLEKAVRYQAEDEPLLEVGDDRYRAREPLGQVLLNLALGGDLRAVDCEQLLLEVRPSLFSKVESTPSKVESAPEPESRSQATGAED